VTCSKVKVSYLLTIFYYVKFENVLWEERINLFWFLCSFLFLQVNVYGAAGCHQTLFSIDWEMMDGKCEYMDAMVMISHQTLFSLGMWGEGSCASDISGLS